MDCKSWYILEINPLWVASFANIFSHSVGSVFILYMVAFAMQKLFRSYLLIFFKFSLLKEVDPKSYCCDLSQSVLPMSSFKSFIVSGPTLRSLIHLSLFLYIVLENVLILFFYMQLSSFPSTTYWNDCLYSIVHSCPLCCRLIDQNCMSLFWGYLSSSIHPLSLMFTGIHVLFTT